MQIEDMTLRYMASSVLETVLLCRNTVLICLEITVKETDKALDIHMSYMSFILSYRTVICLGVTFRKLT